MTKNLSPETVAARHGWDRLRAVKGGRVIAVPAPLLKRPGPPMLLGLECLAALHLGRQLNAREGHQLPSRQAPAATTTSATAV